MQTSARRYLAIVNLLTNPRLSVIEAYGTAAIIFGAALLVRAALDFVIEERLPFITFISAVVLTSLICGFWPSVAVSLASAVTGTLWLAPGETNHIIVHITRFVLFAFAAALIIGLLEALRAAYKELKARDEQLSMVNAELTHRLANLFTIASVLTSQTIRNGESSRAMIESINSRFAALATAQRLLGSATQDSMRLKALVQSVLKPFAPDPARIKISSTAIAIPSESATNLALVLNELATNAIKYAAWSEAHGVVRVQWRESGDRIIIEWSEHDGPPVNLPTRIGAGTTLIQNAISGAVVEYQLEPNGARCTIEMPAGSALSTASQSQSSNGSVAAVSS